MMIITISRQMGALGDLIASGVADTMGLDIVGPHRLHEFAQSCDPEYRDACALYETERRLGFFERLFFDQPAYKSLFEALTYEEASRGNVVLLGRGTQIVLHGIAGVFSAAIVAPEEVRVQRLMEKLGVGVQEAREVVRESDRAQLHLIRLIFHQDPNNWDLYDVVLNTAVLSEKVATEILANAAQSMSLTEKTETYKQLKSLALGKRIESLVRRKLGYGAARNVVVTADPSGAVRITGIIGDKQSKEKVEAVAAGYPGVTKVNCEVKVIEMAYGV